MNGRSLAVDAVALIMYVMAANPALTGIGVHEWLSLAVCVVLFIHCVQHVDWVLDVARRAFSWGRIGNLVLDIFMFIVLAVVTVSGIMISGAVLPAFDLYVQGYYFWDPLHAISAKVFLALLILHILVHGTTMINWFEHTCHIQKGKAE